MTKKNNNPRYFILGFLSFFVALALFIYSSEFQTLDQFDERANSFITLLIIGTALFIFNKRIQKFLDSDSFYFFMRGLSVAFVLIIFAFFGSMVWGVLFHY
jgi:hypothetical protein